MAHNRNRDTHPHEIQLFRAALFATLLLVGLAVAYL